MLLRPLIQEDWRWIRIWFTDEKLNHELGPLDERWMFDVLGREDGIELVAIEDDQPVALIGCAWSEAADKPHGITDIAVIPFKRNSGIGRQALEAVVAWEGHPASGGWVAFVAPENKAVKAFFTRIGWSYGGLDDDMHRFELKHDGMDGSKSV